MNGVHDMGGMHGMGPVDPEPNEPVFHHRWEARVLGIALASGFLRRWNIDMGRYTIEQMPPAHSIAAMPAKSVSMQSVVVVMTAPPTANGSRGQTIARPSAAAAARADPPMRGSDGAPLLSRRSTHAAATP